MLASDDQRALRKMADRLLEHQRVEYIYEDRLTFVPTPGRTHSVIVTRMTESFSDAWHAKLTFPRWDLRAGDFQFEWYDAYGHYFVPDLAIAYPGTVTNTEFRKNLVMVMEITSPKSRETVKHDFGIKYKQYAKGGVPFYLLVDQEKAEWHLYCLRGRWPGYQVYDHGVYGDVIELPEPFGFDLRTDVWPRYTPDAD